MDESEPGTLHSQSPHQPWAFLDPLETFLDAIQGTRDLAAFIRESAAHLGSVEAKFADEARRRLSSVPMEHHVRAATLVHSAIHVLMDQKRALEDVGSSEEEHKNARTAVLDALKVSLEEAVGRSDLYHFYGHVWKAVATRRDPSAALRESLLVSLIGDFEVLVAALIRGQLRARPAILRTDDQRFSMQELEFFSSLDEFRESRGELLADGLMRGGFEDWMDWFGRRHKVAVEGVTDCPAHLIEVFQRRHLLVHNGGIVNDTYARKTGKCVDAAAIGSRATVSDAYLDRAISLLICCGVKLAIEVERKYGRRSAEELDNSLSALTYNLLCRSEFSALEEVTSWHLEWVTNDYARLVAKVNGWLSAKNLRGLDAIERDVTAWETGSLSVQFRLVRHALLDENAAALKLVRQALSTGDLNYEDWQTWPVLDGVRRHAAEEDDEFLSPDTWLFSTEHGDNRATPKIGISEDDGPSDSDCITE